MEREGPLRVARLLTVKAIGGVKSPLEGTSSPDRSHPDLVGRKAVMQMVRNP